MFSKVTSAPRRGAAILNRFRKATVRDILHDHATDLDRRVSAELKKLRKYDESFVSTQAMHAAVSNLTNSNEAIKGMLSSNSEIDFEMVAPVLNERISVTEALLRTTCCVISSDAMGLTIWLLNLLFSAKQKVQRATSVITPDPDPEALATALANLTDLRESSRRPQTERTKMVLPSTLLHQLAQFLFPPERMIVGAARRDGKKIILTGIFDVTGRAHIAGVHADPQKLATALIAMTLTDSYFALWVHSHPGLGIGGTEPSPIDLLQHADWLRDYSPELVSAIIVSDGYVRFWGDAIETSSVTIEVEGPGVEQKRADGKIFKLER